MHRMGPGRHVLHSQQHYRAAISSDMHVEDRHELPASAPCRIDVHSVHTQVLASAAFTRGLTPLGADLALAHTASAPSVDQDRPEAPSSGGRCSGF
jgi:hypothetical protein